MQLSDEEGRIHSSSSPPALPPSTHSFDANFKQNCAMHISFLLFYFNFNIMESCPKAYTYLAFFIDVVLFEGPP